MSCDAVAPHTVRDQPRGDFRSQRAWGGPSDACRFSCDERPPPVRIESWCLEWFDGSPLTRRAGRQAERLVRSLFEWFTRAGRVEAEDDRAVAE